MMKSTIALLALLALNAAPQPASKVIETVTSRYASCTSYRDTGTVRQALPQHEKVWQFSTVYDRGGDFRLQFTTGKHTWKAWTDGGRTWRAWTLDGKTVQRNSIAEAVGEAAGISGGMSTIVPALLGVAPAPSLLSRLTNVHLTGTTKVNGAACAVLEGLDRGSRPAQVYVGVSDNLIHRVVRTMPELGVTTTIDYAPQAR